MIDENNPSKKIEKNFSALDDEFIRVLEDLIDVLLNNGTIRLTDFPSDALQKLRSRKKEREQLRNSLELISDDDASI